MPSHSHSIYFHGGSNTNSSRAHVYLNDETFTINSYYQFATDFAKVMASSGSNSSHTHSLSGTATIALNVKYTDVIICSKN